MKQADIVKGGTYSAKVNNKIVTVRVDEIHRTEGFQTTSNYGPGMVIKGRTYYHVTNLVTGRKTVFRSAVKFRGVAELSDGYLNVI